MVVVYHETKGCIFYICMHCARSVGIDRLFSLPLFLPDQPFEGFPGAERREGRGRDKGPHAFRIYPGILAQRPSNGFVDEELL